jgi:hypothetical protein
MTAALTSRFLVRWARVLLTASSLVVLGLGLALLGGVGPARGQGPKEKLSGVSKEGYEKLFLDASDLPDWKKGQDTKHHRPDPGDRTYARLGGLHTGLVVWRRNQANFERMVDIRWVFPSAKAAQEYLKDQLRAISERMPAVKNAPKIGEETYAFGGPQEILGRKSRSYIIAFRQGNVVVKYFQFEDGADSKLTPLKMAPACLKIVKRIKAEAR